MMSVRPDISRLREAGVKTGLGSKKRCWRTRTTGSDPDGDCIFIPATRRYAARRAKRTPRRDELRMEGNTKLYGDRAVLPNGEENVVVDRNLSGTNDKSLRKTSPAERASPYMRGPTA